MPMGNSLKKTLMNSFYVSGKVINFLIMLKNLKWREEWPIFAIKNICQENLGNKMAQSKTGGFTSDTNWNTINFANL